MISMKNKKWEDIYYENKKLDKIFYEKYQDDHYIYEKNCIEILVELGEFVNETKVFKYWTVKSPNKDKMLEEYADTITMCLTFLREYHLDIDQEYPHIDTDNKIEIINHLYYGMSLLMEKKDNNLIKKIFGNLLYLGELFNFSEDDIIEAIRKKHAIIKERLNSNY